MSDTSDALELTILGSGTAVPSADRFPAGYLVQGAGQTTLVDLGPGTLRRLAAVLGLDALASIDAVFLTHYHTDHCADIAALLFGLCNPRFADRKPLRIYGARGLKALVSGLQQDDVWPWLRKGKYPLELIEIGPGTTALGDDLQVRAVKIEHTDRSLGYRFSVGPEGPALALSGDADVCDGLVELARDAELFVCDSAFPNALRQAGHLTPELAGEHAERAGTRSLCLTHFYPECDGIDLAAEARSTYSGRVVLAEDLAQHRVGRTPA